MAQNDYQAQHKQMRAFFATGVTLDPAWRRQRLQDLYNCLDSHQEDMEKALREDLGKCPCEAYLTEIGETLALLRYYIARIASWSKPRRVWPGISVLPAFSKIYPEPYGVALILSPWNYPLQLSLIPLISALAAGNCAVLKPSRQSPATGDFLQRIVAQVFDGNHCRVTLDQRLVPGEDPEQTANDLLAEKWDFILYTGSARVGRIVMASAARHLTPICLELGGQSPVLVAPDAELPVAAKRISWGKILNAGQTCVAPDYILAHNSIRDKLILLIRREFRCMLGPDPIHNPDYGRIISLKAFERLRALAKQCQVEIDADVELLKIAPAVFAAPKDSPSLNEEIFGPLLPVLSWEHLDEAINFIKSKPKPLACYAFTRDKATREHILRHVAFGGGCINDVVLHASSEHIPFGGVGNSGMGRYHGRQGFDLFSNLKSIVQQWPRFDLPLRYPPYTAKQFSWIRRLLR